MTRIELIITDFSYFNINKISVYLLHQRHPRSHYSKKHPLSIEAIFH